MCVFLTLAKIFRSEGGKFDGRKEKKYPMESVGNTISEPLDFKIFWDRMPPAHPPSTNSHLRRPQLKVGCTVPAPSC